MANLNIEVMPQSIHTVSGICYVETRDEMWYKTFRYANRCLIGNIIFYNIMSDKKKKKLVICMKMMLAEILLTTKLI